MTLLDVVRIKPLLPAVTDSLTGGKDLLINAISPTPADTPTRQKRKSACTFSLCIFFCIIPPLPNLKQQRKLSGLVTGAVGVKTHLLFLTSRL